MRSFWFATVLLVSFGSAAQTRDQVVTNLKKYCETTKNPMAKGSVACKVADGSQSLDELCQSINRKDMASARKLRDVVSHYSMAQEVDDDQAKAQLCAEELKSQSDSVAKEPECLAEKDGTGSVTRKWWNGNAWVTTTKNIKSIRESADSGDAQSQFNLGNWFSEGAPCVAKDMKVAAPYLCKSYDQGFQMAKMAVGSARQRETLAKEFGCEMTDRQKEYAAETKKFEEIAKSNLKKAEAGDVTAMVKVATTYQSSDYGLPQDFKKAFFWAEKAATKGNVEGMALVGSLYNRGDGVEKDDQKAFVWSFKAAQKGDLDSQYFVGLCFYDGQGVEEDLIKAVHWLSKAMDRGHDGAKEHLVQMYLRGELQAAAFKSLVQRVKALEKKMGK